MSNHIYKSNGTYLGFVHNGSIFSRDSAYLGWLEGNYVWDDKGRFRGTLKEIGGHNYVLLNQLQLQPIPRLPKLPPLPPFPPLPQSNVGPISLPVGFIDGFQ